MERCAYFGDLRICMYLCASESRRYANQGQRVRLLCFRRDGKRRAVQREMLCPNRGSGQFCKPVGSTSGDHGETALVPCNNVLSRLAPKGPHPHTPPPQAPSMRVHGDAPHGRQVIVAAGQYGDKRQIGLGPHQGQRLGLAVQEKLHRQRRNSGKVGGGAWGCVCGRWRLGIDMLGFEL